MTHPTITGEELAPIQLRMPTSVQRAIRVDATKHQMKYGAFVMQFYGFAKEGGLDKWLAEKSRSLPPEKREAFQISLPVAAVQAIKLDALNNGLKNGEFVQIVYAFAKKNGLYDWLKK
jgi:hypothetical protein